MIKIIRGLKFLQKSDFKENKIDIRNQDKNVINISEPDELPSKKKASQSFDKTRMKMVEYDSYGAEEQDAS